MKDKIYPFMMGYIGGIPAFIAVEDFQTSILKIVVPVCAAFAFGFAGYFGNRFADFIKKKIQNKFRKKNKTDF